MFIRRGAVTVILSFFLCMWGRGPDPDEGRVRPGRRKKGGGEQDGRGEALLSPKFVRFWLRIPKYPIFGESLA